MRKYIGLLLLNLSAAEITVNLQEKEDVDYFGEVYVGSKGIDQHIIFDTMAEQTTIMNGDAIGLKSPSKFLIEDSDSARLISDENSQSLDFESYEIRGDLYEDKFCVSKDSCLEKFQFVVGSAIEGELASQGIVGLAPSMNEGSLVGQMYVKGLIEYPLVCLDINENKPSKITFGKIAHFPDTWQEFDNQMENKWAFNLTGFSYNNAPFLEDSDLNMKAVLDLKSGDIQVPTQIYDDLIIEMRSHDKSVYSRNIEGRDILLSLKSCQKLKGQLQDIVFMFQDTKISIPPEGYLYEIPGQEHGCFIGISKLEYEEDEVRLGTLFLKHFYLNLKFYQSTQEIMIAPKQGSLAKITPPKKDEDHPVDPIVVPSKNDTTVKPPADDKVSPKHNTDQDQTIEQDPKNLPSKHAIIPNKNTYHHGGYMTNLAKWVIGGILMVVIQQDYIWYGVIGLWQVPLDMTTFVVDFLRMGEIGDSFHEEMALESPSKMFETLVSTFTKFVLRQK